MGQISAKWLKLDPDATFNNSGNLSVLVDGLTIERSASGLRVPADGITDQHIDWGTGANQVSAEDMPVADSGNFFGTDNVEAATQSLASKVILYRHTISGFQNLVPVSNNGDTSSTVLDTPISSITGHNNGGGNSTTVGAVVNATSDYMMPLRDHNTQNPIDDGSGNEVYARLSHNGSEYVVNYYSMVSGTETAYTGFTTTDHIDFAYIYFSQNFMNLPWADVFLSGSWQDLAGVAASLPDDNVSVDGMTNLLSGLTTQAQVNAKLDDLGSTVNGEGASLLAIEDSATFYTGTNIEAALTELGTALGGTDSTTRDFTENNVVADNDDFYTAINKLDQKWGDLASTSNAEGASLVGIEDVDGNFSSSNVEGALSELADSIDTLSAAKTFEIILTATDITNGYVALSSQANGNLANNVLTVDLFNCKTLDGGRADYGGEAILMRNDAGNTDYLVWKNGVTPTGCTNASSGITSTGFGDILEAGDEVQLDATA